MFIYNNNFSHFSLKSLQTSIESFSFEKILKMGVENCYLLIYYKSDNDSVFFFFFHFPLLTLIPISVEKLGDRAG